MGDPNLDKLVLELRRGVITLAVLSQLNDEQYGYSLIQLLSEEGRLEDQGLLESDWRIEESRPRRYYRISAQGKVLLPALRAEWQALVQAMERML
jgi:PadR family transcriptional regulator PadR